MTCIHQQAEVFAQENQAQLTNSHECCRTRSTIRSKKQGVLA